MGDIIIWRIDYVRHVGVDTVCLARFSCGYKELKTINKWKTWSHGTICRKRGALKFLYYNTFTSSVRSEHSFSLNLFSVRSKKLTGILSKTLQLLFLSLVHLNPKLAALRLSFFTCISLQSTAMYHYPIFSVLWSWRPRWYRDVVKVNRFWSTINNILVVDEN